MCTLAGYLADLPSGAAALADAGLPDHILSALDRHAAAASSSGASEQVVERGCDALHALAARHEPARLALAEPHRLAVLRRVVHQQHDSDAAEAAAALLELVVGPPPKGDLHVNILPA